MFPAQTLSPDSVLYTHPPMGGSPGMVQASQIAHAPSLSVCLPLMFLLSVDPELDS